MPDKKKVAILGSTGSIGRNACEVALNLKDEIEIVALSAGKNLDVFIPQVNALRPRFATLADENAFSELGGNLPEETETVSEKTLKPPQEEP